MDDSAPRIENPILPGFNPDPSIVRVGDDYYIATSTFEWFPGVQIHHSRDLIHWRLIARPLSRPSQLNMLGDPDSCGIWAPCLTFDDGQFYLVYTDVKRYGRTSQAGSAGASLARFSQLSRDQRVRSRAPWSDPVFLNSSGFDPSLFHDDDGRKYLVNMLWDHRPGRNRFAGIVLQEYSAVEQRLVGPRHRIFEGTRLGFTEAPHLYKRDGFYYLLVAEGGTGWGHAVTMARSRTLTGPYELHPGRSHPHVSRSTRRPAAARRPRGPRRDAGRRYLHGVSVRPSASQSRALHAGSRDGDPADGLGRRRVAPNHRRRRPSSRCGACAAVAARTVPASAGTGGLRQREAADSVSVAAIAVAGGAVQPHGASRTPATVRP